MSYYFIQIRLAFQPMEKSDSDLEEIFDVLHAIKIHATNAAKIHATVIEVLKKLDWSAEKKKMFLRKFSRYFQGAFEEISAKNKPDLQDLTPEQVDAVILYFTKKVSKKDYQVYFKNIEKEIIPPEGFFAKLRFDYRNDIAFMFRILKNSFAEIVLYGILFTAILVIGFAALMLFTLMSEIALPLIVALSVIGETAVELAYVVPIIFMAIIPMVAGALHDYKPFDSYFFLAKTIILTAIVGIPSVIFDVVFYRFITIASLFHTKPVIEQDGPQPDLVAKPGSEPDPLASKPKEDKRVAQSKQENSGVKKEKPAEPVSSNKRPGPNPSTPAADADGLD